MAKPKTTKKKGPKGKKARAKAKLDRHWGESAIVDDEKPRRIGKSRLLARTKKDDERKTIRWASDDQRTREGETKPYSKESKADFQGALKNKKASFVSTKSSVHNDDESFSDSEIESDNEDDPPLQGLLRTIQKAKAKKEFPNRKANRRDPEEDSEIDDLQEDAAVDTVMEDCEGDNNEEDEIFLQSKDINNEDEFDDDDSVDEDGNSSSHKPALDLFHQHFRQEPLGQDELQNILPTTSKATVNESVDMLLTVPFSDRSSHYPAFNFNTKPEDLQTLAESSFEGNRKILQLRWKRLNKVTMTKKQYPIYPFLTRYMDLFVKTDTRKVGIFLWILCLSNSLTSFTFFITTGSRRTSSALLVAYT